MRWPMGETATSLTGSRVCFSYFLERPSDSGSSSEAGVANGAAVWIPPRGFDSWESHPWNQPRIGALSDDGGRRYDAFWRWIDTHTLRRTTLATRLDRRAILIVRAVAYGAALISTGLARAEADGVGAFLSTGTPRNVSIYERCGFRVVEDADAPDGGRHVWFMRWDPNTLVDTYVSYLLTLGPWTPPSKPRPNHDVGRSCAWSGGRELPATDIASHFGEVTRSAVSQHLGVLREAGLVIERRDGNPSPLSGQS